jgi:hypothetical protein
MQKWFPLFLLAVLSSSAATARNYNTVALIPETPVRPESSLSNVNSQSGDTGDFSLGIELGGLGRQWTTDGRYSNLDVLMGGRLFGEWEVANGIIIRPSFGYFGSSTTVGLSNVFQSDFEAGLSIYLEAAFSTEVRALFGVANRVDLMLANVSPYSVTTAPGTFAYRPGPAVGLEVSLGPRTQLVIDGELTFSVFNNWLPYGSAAAGITQKFW